MWSQEAVIDSVVQGLATPSLLSCSRALYTEKARAIAFRRERRGRERAIHKMMYTLGTALPPLSNSRIISKIWLFIALNRTPNIDCYWGGSTQCIQFTASTVTQYIKESHVVASSPRRKIFTPLGTLRYSQFGHTTPPNPEIYLLVVSRG